MGEGYSHFHQGSRLNWTLPSRLANHHSGKEAWKGAQCYFVAHLCTSQVITGQGRELFKVEETALAGAQCVNMQGTGGLVRQPLLDSSPSGGRWGPRLP